MPERAGALARFFTLTFAFLLDPRHSLEKIIIYGLTK